MRLTSPFSALSTVESGRENWTWQGWAVFGLLPSTRQSCESPQAKACDSSHPDLRPNKGHASQILPKFYAITITYKGSIRGPVWLWCFSSFEMPDTAPGHIHADGFMLSFRWLMKT
jgi:hypothetical protein